jgi:phage tail-like protein
MPTISRDKQFAFKIEIDGIPRVAFKTCSELEMAVGVLSTREGGKLMAEKEAGLVTFPDITIGGARTTDRSFYDWMKQVCNVISGYAEAAGATYMRTFDVVQMDRDGSEIRRYRVVNAWPNNRKVGPWDNDAEEYVQETIVFSCDYWHEV